MCDGEGRGEEGRGKMLKSEGNKIGRKEVKKGRRREAGGRGK